MFSGGLEYFIHLSLHTIVEKQVAPLAQQSKVSFLFMFRPFRLSSVAEDTIRAYFESRLVLLEPVFPLACHRLCEGPDFSLEFGFKSQPQPEGKTYRFFKVSV